MSKFVCSVCGYVYEGEAAPKECPICHAPAEKFNKVEETAITWADEHKVGVAEGLDEEVVAGLRENFNGECSEVGMYLAMARVAYREGYPEVFSSSSASSSGEGRRSFSCSNLEKALLILFNEPT